MIETFRSPRSPWEIFQAVHTHSPACFFLDSPNTDPLPRSGNGGSPDSHFSKGKKTQDSPHHVSHEQRYSYIGMDPDLEIRLDEKVLRVEGELNGKYPAGELFPALKKVLAKYQVRGRNPHPFFAGGFVGYFGYETADLCDKIKFRPRSAPVLPRLYLGLFRNVIVYDHQKRVYHIVMNTAQRATCNAQRRKPKSFFKGPALQKQSFRFKKFTAEMTKGQFERMVEKAKEYIAAGDIYQANLSQRFSFGYRGSSLELYGKLRAINPSPFSCFLKTRDLEIVSSSPERLVRKKGRTCETRPIAGTCPARGASKRLVEWRKNLLQNEKEKAEHLMLVDLERNDLGRVCSYRSVKVKEFMTLEKYSHVVHIVSKITGKLKKDKDALDLIKAMFPGGTITGCPKIRCMQIIDELEPVKRGIYTGSLGYLDLYGDMDLNIVIRTILLRRGKGHLQVGAGIVYDSDPKKEYEETLHKAKALTQSLREAGGNK
ncbi:MAG: anthranilate synthase component I family protein [Candidatus Omnitrophota bacterium]